MRRYLSASLLFAVVVLPSAASGQERSAATADALFQQGHQLYEQKKYAEACPIFAESYRVDPATGSLLALASCHEAEGKLASAWAEYNDTVARARADGRADRAEAAQQRATALEPKLGRITIVLGPGGADVPGLEVKRDGVVLGAAAYGIALPVDRGEHAIEVGAPGYQKVSTRVSVADGASQSITIPRLVELPKVAAADARPPESQPRSGGSALRPVGMVTGGVGLVTVAVGGYFGIRAIAKNSDSNADRNCVGNSCNAPGAQARRDALSAGNTSTALMVIGGVLAAGGVALFILGGPSSESKPAVTASPAMGAGMAGFQLGGRF